MSFYINDTGTDLHQIGTVITCTLDDKMNYSTVIRVMSTYFIERLSDIVIINYLLIINDFFNAAHI